MNNKTKTLAEQCLELCYQIEKCVASKELTEASIMATELYNRLKYPTDHIRISVASDVCDDDTLPPEQLIADRKESEV